MSDNDKEITKVQQFLERIKHSKTECESKYALDKLVDFINILDSHMGGNNSISGKDIQSMIDFIVGYNTRIFDSKLPCKTRIKRGQIVNIESVKSIERLSYNKNNHNISQGRFNCALQSVFYGVIYFDQNAGTNIIFSELCAKENDHISILNSTTNKEIAYRQLGLFTRIHHGNRPWYICDDIWKYYNKIYELHKEYLYESDFISFLLAENFLYNTLSKKGSQAVYDITNAIADILLDNQKIDGLVFESVFDNSTPNIILKQSAVDKKITFLNVESFKINKIYPYNLYKSKITHQGKILHNGAIEWSLCD